MSRLLLLTLFVTAPVWALAQNSNGLLTGTVIDRQTLTPLSGANILLKNTTLGSSSDTDGKFTVSNIPAGIYTVIVRYIGYETQYFPDIVIHSNRTRKLVIKLKPKIMQGGEVMVTSGYFSQNDARDISRVSFSPEEIRRFPGAGQELSRVLMSLPGVASRGETSQDLLVRGGSPRENGFYIDNIPMPGVRHFANRSGSSNGPIGIVNTELVEDIDFSTGGFPVIYGDRLSSISSISYREGSRQHFRGNIGLNMAGFNVGVEGPFAGKEGSFLLSVRRSYLDLIAGAINTGGAPSFGDIQGKVVYDLNQKNRLSFLTIYGKSTFERTADDALEEELLFAAQTGYNQNTSGLNWRTLWNDGYTNTSLSYSVRNMEQLVTDAETVAREVDFETRQQFVALRSVSYYRINEKNSIEFGADIRWETNNFDYFIGARTNTAGEQRPDFARNLSIDGTLASVFLSYTAHPFPKLTTTLGARALTNSYNNDLNADINAQAHFQLTPRLGLNGAFGVYHQTVPRYILSQKPAFQGLKNMRAIHYIAGFDYLLTNDTQLTLEVYKKQYYNTPILPQVNNINNPFFVLDNTGVFYTALDDDGTAFAQGIELFIQKKLAVNFYGMISATYLRSRYHDFEGNLQNRDYDNRYLFGIVGGYRPNDKWEVSVRWSWMGGRPYTPIDLEASQREGTEILNMNRFNRERLPDYHSLYLRGDRRFFFDRTNLVVFIEIWNVYNRANVDGYFYHDGKGTIEKVTQFSFLPVGGVKFEF